MNQPPATTIPAAGLAPRTWQAAMALGALLLGALVLGGAVDRRQFAFSFLVSWVFAVSLAAGGLFWVLLHHLTGAVWSVVVRRTAEHLAAAIIPVAVLGIPAMLSLGATHGWISQPDAVWEKKSAYLNVPFFLIRTGGFLACWCGLALALRRLSLRHDARKDDALLRRARAIAPLGIIILGATTTFFAFDWLMSLEWHWTSTMFGVTFWAGAIVGALALITLLVLGLQRLGLSAITAEHLHDLGKLLFGFTVFWAYIAFSQYFLVWYANLREETPWYLHRLEGSWRGVTAALLFGHFALPFAWLLPRQAKRTPWRLGLAAAWLLAFHLVDIYWQVMPVLHPSGVNLSVLDLVGPAGMLAVIVGVVLWGYARFAPVPAADPRLAESLAHHVE